jgi:hypothetical protein
VRAAEGRQGTFSRKSFPKPSEEEGVLDLSAPRAAQNTFPFQKEAAKHNSNNYFAFDGEPAGTKFGRAGPKHVDFGVRSGVNLGGALATMAAFVTPFCQHPIEGV